MTQLGLMEWADTRPGRGSTFDVDRDEGRLQAQYLRVRNLMVDGQWRTLGQISDATKDPQASVSARLRQMRSAGYVVNRRYVSRGLWEYQAMRNPSAAS